MLADSAVGAPFVGYKRAAFLDPDGTPVAFALDLADKDLRLIADLADAIGVPMPQASANLEVIQAAATGGRGSATSRPSPNTCGDPREPEEGRPALTTVAGQDARPDATRCA